MRRVSVVGNSGSGKTTLGRALARLLDVPFVELDAIFHQPNWSPLPAEEFRRRVGEVAAGDGWVIDGGYGAVRPIVWGRADTVVWLDPPRWRVMGQLLARTVRRAARRTELWNGNRESFRNMFTPNRETSILLWSWTSHRTVRDRYGTAMTDPAWAGLRFVRLRSRREAARFLLAV